MADNLGRRLVRALVSSKDLTILTKIGISELDLFEEGKAAYDWLVDYVRSHGEWPTAKMIEESVGIELPEEPDKIEYICDLVRKRSLGKDLEREMKRAAEKLEGREPDDALDIMTDAAFRLKGRTVASDIVRYRKSRKARMDAYEEAKAAGGLIGIPTPWKSLNVGIQGWVDGTFNVITGMQNTGKAQPLNGIVWTPSGPQMFQNLSVGDLVATQDGTFTKVAAIYPRGIRPMYRVLFSDGTSAIVCTEHLWRVKRSHQKNWKVVTSEQLKTMVRKDRPWQIPMARAVQYPERKLRIDPYVMGVILGDGGVSGHALAITTADSFIANEIERLIWWNGCELKRRPNGSITFDIVGIEYRVNAILEALRYYKVKGKKSRSKTLPLGYQYGSISQRLALLQGMLDTDGWVEKTGCIGLNLSSERLLDGIRELVQSLGGTATKGRRKATDSWRSYIVLPKGIVPFRLPKKKNAYMKANKQRSAYRAVVGVEEAPPQDCLCIAVEHPSHLYLTNDYIVTHNSWVACICAEHCLQLAKRVLFITLEMATPRIARRIDALRFKIPFRELRDASMSAEREMEYEELLSRDELVEGDIIFADKKLVRTVSDVLGLVMEYKPDIVFVDGGYRFESRRGRGQWESTVNIVNDLQATAESTGIPWVVTTQQGDANETGKEHRRGPKITAWGVRYGKEWVINPDVVIGLYQNDDLRLIKAMEISRLKMRDAIEGGGKLSFRINWDLNLMNFDEAVTTSGTEKAVVTF